jgi:hypothetical protein
MFLGKILEIGVRIAPIVRMILSNRKLQTLFLHRIAAIDHKGLPRDVSSITAHQELNERGDLIWCATAP